MNRPLCIRVGLIGALAAVLLLTGCGRKGQLDPPPGAEQLQQNAPTVEPSIPPRGAPQSGFDEDDRPVAPPSKKTRHFLDWLLD